MKTSFHPFISSNMSQSHTFTVEMMIWFVVMRCHMSQVIIFTVENIKLMKTSNTSKRQTYQIIENIKSSKH